MEKRKSTPNKSPKKPLLNGNSPKSTTPPSNGKSKTSKRRKSNGKLSESSQNISNYITILPKSKEISVEINTNEENHETSPLSTPKIDAFAFMMNNRHKVIGTNSPGKELDKKQSPNSSQENRDVKTARKKLLEDWSETKGASKRKREYEEAGNWLNDKLDKRAKKLKKMLKVTETQSDDEIIVNKKRKSRIIDTESENSRDSFLENDKKPQGKRNRRKKKLSLKKELNDDESDDPIETATLNSTSLKQYKNKIKEKLIKNDTKNANIISVEEDNCIIVENKNEIDENNELNLNSRVLRQRKAKPKSFDMYLLDDDEKKTKSSKKPAAKVASIFLKSLPKPKIDPEIIEARRQFLLSSIPSNLKKDLIKQPNVQETDFDVFPTISHIAQLDQNDFIIPQLKLELKNDFDFDFQSILAQPFDIPIKKDTTNIDFIQHKKISKFKKIIVDLKSQNPNYPVYKIFNFIRSKNSFKPVHQEITPKRGRGRPKKIQTKPDQQINKNNNIKHVNNNNNLLWTEKYKPLSSSDIIGNYKSVQHLKKWLNNWLNVKYDCRKLKKRSDSISDFEITDSDSRDSVKMYSNSVILSGPCGTGKTSAVYAICNELGFNVLEVNASSKRTGKWLLQELQEATQSHQIRKTDSKLSSFLKNEKKTDDTTTSKMCVLLIEDIDVVFDQDEGFLNGLSQIMTSSKRPFILTTTDPTSPIIQKFISQYEVIKFTRLSSSILTIWLQILCLVDGGILIDPSTLEELMEFNKCDVRKTILQLQFWVHSGGQIIGENNTEIVVKSRGDLANNQLLFNNELFGEDDTWNLSELKPDDDEELILHSNCVSSFENIRKYHFFQLPYILDLDILHLNISNLFNLEQEIQTDKKQQQRFKLQSLSDFYNDICQLDTIYNSFNTNSKIKLKDSLELENTLTDFYKDERLTNDLTHSILSKRILLYKEKQQLSSGLNMGGLSSTQQRMLSKRILCDDVLKNAIPKGCLLDRKAVALDYLPNLRNIARSETDKAVNKRGNRFCHSLKSFGVHCGESTYELLSDVFQFD